jgi:DNA-binding NtrC family response regulator
MRNVLDDFRGVTATHVLVVGRSALTGLSRLDACGFSATPCPDARNALKMLDDSHHDAVLCDLEMPGMGGMALLDVVRVKFPDVAVVMITRPGKLRNGVLAMIAGASGYVQMPLQPEMVAASLKSALIRKQLDSAMYG